MNPIRMAAVILVLYAGVSCQHLQESSTRNAAHHIVICWLKEPGDMDARRQVMDASFELAEIPGVINVRAGSVLPDTRPTVDSTFDVALVITFKDEQSLREYVNHPIHKNAVETAIKPLVSRYIAYDFIDGK